MRHSHGNPSRRYHDRVARRYDQMYDDLYWEFHDELTWRAVKPHLPRDLSARCLDLGCGTGKWGMRLLKSGFATSFVDHSPAMIDQTRLKVDAMGSRARKAELFVADITGMPMLADSAFSLTLAMGDPLSICADPPAAAREMYRVCAPGGVVIATADGKLAALDHYLEQRQLDELERFVRTSRTHWLTEEAKERFELHTFTPATLRGLFAAAGFEVISIVGKTVLPVRKHRGLLEQPGAMERLLRLEQELWRDPDAAARASHLQILARK